MRGFVSMLGEKGGTLLTSVWAAINNIIASLAALVDALLSTADNVVYVNNGWTGTHAQDGSFLYPYKSLQDAIDSITDSSANNTYLIEVILGKPYTGTLTISVDYITINGNGASKGAGYTGTVNSTSQHLTVQNVHIKAGSVFNQIREGDFLLEFKDTRFSGTLNCEATGTTAQKQNSYLQVTGDNTLWQNFTANITGILGFAGVTGGAYMGSTGKSINVTDSYFCPGLSCVDGNTVNLYAGTTAEFLSMYSARNTLNLETGATLYADITVFSTLGNTINMNGGTLIKVSPAVGIAVTDAGEYYTGTDVEAVLQEVGAALENKRAITTITSNTDASPALGALVNNSEYRCTNTSLTTAPTMTLAAIASTTVEFVCAVLFKAPNATAPVVTNNSGYTLKYVGDDVSSGTWTPVADTVYRMSIVFDGIYVKIDVSGVA